MVSSGSVGSVPVLGSEPLGSEVPLVSGSLEPPVPLGSVDGSVLGSDVEPLPLEAPGSLDEPPDEPLEPLLLVEPAAPPPPATNFPRNEGLLRLHL